MLKKPGKGKAMGSDNGARMMVKQCHVVATLSLSRKHIFLEKIYLYPYQEATSNFTVINEIKTNKKS
jgi:hypothetical protein